VKLIRCIAAIALIALAGCAVATQAEPTIATHHATQVLR
jgi:hypothetical protein